MGSIGRYIFRTTLGAFLVVLVSLTAVIWVTQALRDIDLMTNQGQTILVFLGITGLIIPLLVLVIAPLALVIAIAHVLNKLSTDSELIVMNASGMSPWWLFKPLLAVTILVSILVTATSAYLAPEGLRALRRWAMEVRTDLVSNIIQPGNFIGIERGLIFHIRERKPNGLLGGLLVDDRRDEKERVTIVAEQGEIIKNDRGAFLLLENGSIQRHEAKQRDPTIVMFDRYAFDLSQFTSTQAIKYSTRERYLWQLMTRPDTSDPMFEYDPGQFRAELHDRIIAILYPFVFAVVVYAYLGAPRTTRQSRGWSILNVIAVVGGVRLIGFASSVVGVQIPFFLLLQYVILLTVLAGGIFVISRGIIPEPPAFVVNGFNAFLERFARRKAVT
jgi:lipopolysaccharide export system permease protein